MKPFYVLAIAAAILAGCLQPNEPSPQAQPTGVVLNPTPTPTSEGIAVGEPTPSRPPGGGMLVRPAHDESTNDSFVLTGDESVSGFIAENGSVTFSFVASNQGADAQAISDPCGAGNPRIEIRDENGTPLALAPPSMHCMVAISWQPFAAGASIEANLTWDGTAYHDADKYDAPPGRYMAVATFDAKRGDREVLVVVEIPVNVIAASDRGVL